MPSFRDQMDVITRHILSREVRIVGIKAHTRIVRRTPVDTGRARGGWNIDFSNRRELPIVYITNNVEYIQRLEDGHSREQAPNGMVAITISELTADR